MRFIDFLHTRVGHNWVVAKNTSAINARYGSDVVCLTRKAYADLVDEYETTTGLAAHGRPGEPCDHRKAAANDLYAALKSTRLMLYAWKAARKNMNLADDHKELNDCIADVEVALAKANAPIRESWDH